MTDSHDDAESRRLAEATTAGWRGWGPYLAERQWGTVREDYSADGEAWEYFPHDHARWRAYRWGEDGIAGFSDDKQNWCLALALWNGKDAILKERMFGLTNAEGNHGEDVKELWWYLDGTPTHSLMRMLYKYPHAPFPYDALIAENAARKSKNLPEYEIEDTGVFNDGRYFDVAVDYAKAAPEDVLMRVTVSNRGTEPATLHVLPQLWARNTWSWDEGSPRPVLALDAGGHVEARREGDAVRRFEALQPAAMLFCDNETNQQHLCGKAVPGYPKDGICERVTTGRLDAVNPTNIGTKCAAHAELALAPDESRVLRFRFAPAETRPLDEAGFDEVFAAREAEADAFYAAIQQGIDDPDARLVQRQALAGMLWSKQYYLFDVQRWLDGDPSQPAPPPSRRRDRDWRFLHSDDVISMPDTWEYPWYASWDLAFHAVTFALIDPAFAKEQLLLLMHSRFMNPNGQLPAYEWEFGDANPPVQAWAALRIFRIDRLATGKGDLDFLARAFRKLLINFTWWVNRQDSTGRNLFQGGFLGLDNIGVFDRSKPLPTGGVIEQADGTAWMAAYALHMMRMALELAEEDHSYEEMAVKFFDHFLLIAGSMADADGSDTGLWDDWDGFFYDMLALDNGERVPLRVRSLVGLIPLFAVEVLSDEVRRVFPHFAAHLRETIQRHPALAALISHWEEAGIEDRMLLSLLRYQRMSRLLARMFDKDEFLSPFGIRSVSKIHATEPYTYDVNGKRYSVDYEPGESTTVMFGGNSNWRGPIWMPINALIIEALYEFEAFYGDGAKIELPLGSGRQVTLAEAAAEISRRLTGMFLRGADGERPTVAGVALYRDDPHFAGLVPFHEYFHAETGRGLGASHQTGWTGVVALLLQPRLREAGALTPAARR
jgi:hypothetical protein